MTPKRTLRPYLIESTDLLPGLDSAWTFWDPAHVDAPVLALMISSDRPSLKYSSYLSALIVEDGARPLTARFSRYASDSLERSPHLRHAFKALAEPLGQTPPYDAFDVR